VSTMLDPLNPIGNGGTTYGYDAARRLSPGATPSVKVKATQPPSSGGPHSVVTPVAGG